MTEGLRARRVVPFVAAAVAVLAIALPASVSALDHHFSVVSEQTRGHRTSNGGFAFRIELFNPANVSNMVGHGHARCNGQPRRKARCKVIVHLDGTIGGFGDLFLKGNLGGRDHTLNVADGDGDFSGRIAGKAFIHHLNSSVNLIDFDLTR
jgi:hypothetical protein